MWRMWGGLRKEWANEWGQGEEGTPVAPLLCCVCFMPCAVFICIPLRSNVIALMLCAPNAMQTLHLCAAGQVVVRVERDGRRDCPSYHSGVAFAESGDQEKGTRLCMHANT